MTTLKQFTGLRNQQRPERLEPGSLIACNNVILDDTGALETRFGYFHLQSLNDIKDGFTMPHERYGFILADGKLYNFDMYSSFSMRTAVENLTETHLHFAAVGNTLLYVGNKDAGRVVDGMLWYPLRMPMPPQPTVHTAGIPGNLHAGQYQVTQTYWNLGAGLETPAPASLNVEVAENAGMFIEANPPSGYAVNFFVTPPNGTAERYIGTSYGGMYNHDTLNESLHGRTLDQWQTNTQTLPEGNVVGLAIVGLCAHVAFYDSDHHRTQIVYSQRGSYQAYRLSKETYGVAGLVKQMLGVDEGVLIATNQAVWLWSEDGTDAGTMTRLSNYGCPNDRCIDRDATGITTITTNRGQLLYPPINDQARLKFIPPKANTVSTAIIQQNGLHLVLVTADETGEAYTAYQP
jgi:hypothetical protein